MTDAADQVAAAKKALEDAQAALAAAEEQAKQAEAQPAVTPPVNAAATSTPPVDGPLQPDAVATIEAGYAFDGAALQMGALVNGEPVKDAQIRIPIAMVNRHG